MDGWGLGMLTEVDLLPAFGVRWTGTVDAAVGPVDLRGTTAIDLVPFDIAGLNLLAGIGLLDMAGDGYTATIDASLLTVILPAFGTTLSVDLAASFGAASLWSNVALAVPGFGVTALTGAEVRVLDLELDDGGLTLDLGTSATLLPAIDAQFWFDAGLQLGVVTITAQTEFELMPFGLAEQRIEVEVALDALTIAAWFSFDGTGDLAAGITGTYDFP